MQTGEPTPDFPRPDWREAGAYAFTQSLNVAQWTWEFLRRNPDYRRDWAWFDRNWKALEADYGRPPERDFQRWKADPRAWVRADDCGGDCRIDQDRVLIECWMGAKWGFYKFPLDPATDNPLGPERLRWRERVQPVVTVTPQDTAWLAADPARVAAGFELDLPLKPQLERVTRWLQARQARLRKSGELQMRTLSSRRETWLQLLRCADALAAGVGEREIRAVLDVDVARARRLVGGGHLELLDTIDD